MRYFKFNGITISPESEYMLTATTGADGGTVTRRETHYVDVDGMSIDDVLFEPRVIDIEGFIMSDNIYKFNNLKRNLITACNPKEKFTLTYFNGETKYVADVQPDQLPVFTKIKPMACEFVIYLNMYNFYWGSESDIVKSIFRRTDKVNGSFNLPCVFTERTTKANCINNGDATTFARIEAVCQSSPSFNEITIKNNTTSETFAISYTPDVGETIVIDMENRKVTSSIHGNIIKHVNSSSTWLRLEKGENEIEAVCPGMMVTSYHRNRFLGV